MLDQNRIPLTALVIFIMIFLPIYSLNAQCHINDWTALKALYENTRGDNWTNKTGWEIVKQNSPPANCNLNNLFGVDLDANFRVENIILDNNQLNGVLPNIMGTLLSNLKKLSLHNNYVGGAIPAELGNLNNLIKLILSKNLFSGAIPAELGNLTNLKFLSLGFNQFKSEIPIQLGNMSSLIQLAISNNAGLYGKIPIELGNLSQLKLLSFSACELTGNIPKQLGQLSNLDQLILSNNLLSGSIPVELGSLAKLTKLELAWNNLSDDIPTTLSDLDNLTILKLSGNQLTGKIPDGFCNLTQLTNLSLAYNNLKNNIPPKLANLYNLTTLKLEWNQLTGSIPSQLASLSNLTSLDVRHNKLGGCYNNELSSLCTQLNPSLNNNISVGNYFTAAWENFCSSNEGSCSSNQNLQVFSLPTNYSGNVNATVTLNQNGAYIIKNNYIEVVDYSICSDINDAGCVAVTGTNNYAANEALWSTEKAADLLLNEYQLNLPPVISFVNSTYNNNSNSSVFKSDINKIIYGKGDGLERNSLTSTDIVGHEYMHYVIKNFNNLSNYGESGALQESFADIFGEVLEHYCYGNNDWIFGSMVMINKPGIRSLKNPKNVAMLYQQPNTYKGEYWVEVNNVCLFNDYCGVHTNSGVQNYWFYLLANGGSGVNDNGDTYNIAGIGIKKAANITFNSLLADLKPNATYNDVVFSSIQAAKTLYGENANEVQQTINAWLAVGLYNINPIKWQAVNFIQTGSPIENTNDGLYRIPIEFDLAIDSLGEDISADGLSFTFHKPVTYENLKIETMAPLSENEVIIEEDDNAIKVQINRQTNNGSQQNIPNREPAFKVVTSIVVIDIAGEEIALANPYISGGTQVLPSYFVPHETVPLILGTIEADPNTGNQLKLSVGLTNQSCGALASVRIEVLNYNASANSSLNYYLRNLSGVLVDSYLSTPRTFHQFYNLPFGNYEIYVEDQESNQATQIIKIEFVADSGGSSCCPDYLIIPPGEIQGNFNALETVSIDIGADVKQGTIISICNE